MTSPRARVLACASLLWLCCPLFAADPPPKSATPPKAAKPSERKSPTPTGELKVGAGGASIATDLKPDSNSVSAGLGPVDMKAGENELEIGVGAKVGGVLQVGPKAKVNIKSQAIGPNDQGVHPSSLSGFDVEASVEPEVSLKGRRHEVSGALSAPDDKKLKGQVRFGENPYYKAQTLNREVDKIFADDAPPAAAGGAAPAAAGGAPAAAPSKPMVKDGALVIDQPPDLDAKKWDAAIAKLQKDFSARGRPLESETVAGKLRIRSQDLTADEIKEILRRFPRGGWELDREPWKKPAEPAAATRGPASMPETAGPAAAKAAPAAAERPSGFSKTLSYLEPQMYPYEFPSLQQARQSILHDNLETTVIAGLKQANIPPSGWQAEGDRAIAAYGAQDAQLRTVIRQTRTDAEAIISAVDGNQPISGALLAEPMVQALILLKWQLLQIREQTRQALLYAGLASGGEASAAASANAEPPVATTPPASAPATKAASGAAQKTPATSPARAAKAATPPATKGEAEAYWFDPSDKSAGFREDDNKSIYVVLKGSKQAKRMTLKAAKAAGYVPADATTESMTRYRESSETFENDVDTSQRKRPRS